MGASGYGDTYLQSVLAAPADAQVTFAGVADPAPDRCRYRAELGAAGVPFYGSFEELLDAQDDLGLLMLCTPIHLHAPHACAAVNRGIHVLCEKPLAGSLADAQRMLTCERTSGKFIAVGFQWSFSAAINELKADITAGRLGRPKRLRTLVSFPRTATYYARNGWVGRAKTPAGEAVLDSPVNNAAAHYLHNMLWVLGASAETSATPDSVSAELYRAKPIETYDTAALRLTVGGAELLFLTTHAAHERLGPAFQFEFEEGTVTYDALRSPDVVAKLANGRSKNYGNPSLDRNEKIWQCVKAVRNGTRPTCTVRAAMPHTQVVVAAQKAPVADFDPALLETVTAGDETMTAVRGLGQVLADCHARGALPSELGDVPWTTTPTTVEVGRAGKSATVPA